MKKSCFWLLVLISFFFVKPISAKTLGAQEISDCKGTHSENQLRFRRDFSQKELKLSGNLNNYDRKEAIGPLNQQAKAICILLLSEDQAMEFVETGRGTNIFQLARSKRCVKTIIITANRFLS